MNDFAAEIREAARAALPENAFLRRDRGDALFVTNAPRLRPEADWRAALADAGFSCETQGGLLFLTPGQRWLDRLQACFPEPADHFSGTLARFAALPATPEALLLFARGARILDGEPDDGAFERGLRQAVAVALRRGGSGGLYACALLRAILVSKTERDSY